MQYYIYGITLKSKYVVLRVENPKSMGIMLMSLADIVEEGGKIRYISVGSRGCITCNVNNEIANNAMLSTLIYVKDILPLLAVSNEDTPVYVTFDKMSARIEFSLTTYSVLYGDLSFYGEETAKEFGFSYDDILSDYLNDVVYPSEENIPVVIDVDLSEWFDEFGECVYNIIKKNNKEEETVK